MKWDPFIFGISCVCTSVVFMIYGHEYTISGGVFILGMLLVGYAYAKSPRSKPPQINTEQVNKNIQIYNDLLWGKQEKKEDEYDTIEIKVKRRK